MSSPKRSSCVQSARPLTPNPDEAKSAADVDVSEQLASDADHDPRVIGRCGQSCRAGQGREVVQPDFHRDRPAGQPGRPKALDDPAGHAVDHRSQLRNVGNVTLEGVLDAHRF